MLKSSRVTIEQAALQCGAAFSFGAHEGEEVRKCEAVERFSFGQYQARAAPGGWSQ
ncbi:hypothetical protein [Streptomyces sp. NBC_00328]|uniref:hypothetical protein n=1 Tax=Streptomyces sp. NBC_00328 TaxID=2903646 RepID=UPI002E2AB02A|nr:hypothetical protein [Streptomyces sp. NBC_00328]